MNTITTERQHHTPLAAAADYSLLAPVPLPPGVESAEPWQLDDEGHPFRVLSNGAQQNVNGTLRVDDAAVSSERDWDDVEHTADYSTYVAFGEELNERNWPLPDGATTDSYWSRLDANGIRTRDLFWDDFDVEGNDEAYVGIGGRQFTDGRVENHIVIHLRDDGEDKCTADTARGLLAALQAAVTRYDEIESANGSGRQ